MFVKDIESTTEIIQSVKDKNILFLSPAFFNYEKVIVEKMREMGACVDFYDERSVTSAMDRALLKIFPQIFSGRTLRYYDDIIKVNIEKNYDYILIIKCDMVSSEILDKFRRIYPRAKLCLYMWDSIENIPGVENKVSKFDTAHSFDINDCQRISSLKFRPLFFTNEFEANSVISAYREKFEYDICFVGTIHSDRYSIIRQVKKWAKRNNKKFFSFCYLQSKFIYYFYKLTKKEFFGVPITEFSFDKISAREISNIVSKSKVVLDAQHPSQTGLTMRTIEMLGMGKKMITTNKTVAFYDFYSKDNIYIVDRDCLCIDDDFFQKPYKPIDKAVYKKYLLENWILEVLS